MNIPHPVPEPLTQTTGSLTMTIAAFVNVDLTAAPAGPDGPATGAHIAVLLDEALITAKLPEGCTAVGTMLQLAVHSP